MQFSNVLPDGYVNNPKKTTLVSKKLLAKTLFRPKEFPAILVKKYLKNPNQLINFETNNIKQSINFNNKFILFINK